jgi:flagellar motor switch protein FliN/FliY
MSVVPEEVAVFLEAWAESLSQVLSQVAGTPHKFTVTEGEDAAAGADDCWFTVNSSQLQGELGLRLSLSDARRLAQTFLGEPVVEGSELSQEHREAALELLRQVAGQCATRLPAISPELSFHIECTGAPSWPPAHQAQLADAGGLSLRATLSAALAAALRPVSPAAAVTSAPAGATTPMPLLMGVKLEVTLRFGQRRMRLRDVLELGPGSVVELDRKVKEPVELLLDGKLLARGEVVVVDGGYGLRVTEVAAAAAAKGAA